MGVYRDDYVMWAVNVGADKFDWNKHEKEAEGAPDRRFDVIYDGMSGEYCMAGKIVAKAAEHEGFRPKKLDLDIDKQEIANKLSEAFDMSITAGDISLILFSHYG